MIGLDGEVFAAGRGSLRFHRLASSGVLNLYNSWGLSRLCYQKIMKSLFDSGFLSASNYLHIPASSILSVTRSVGSRTSSAGAVRQ